MICPQCQNLYPPHYKECVKCCIPLVVEKPKKPQPKKEAEDVEAITPYVEMSELKVGEY